MRAAAGPADAGRASWPRFIDALADVSVLAVFFVVASKLLVSIFNRSVGGMDDVSHFLNVVKIAQSGCRWNDILLLYNDVNFTPYHLQLHYPPVAYLSSFVVCASGVDFRVGVAVANLIWMFLGYVSIAASLRLIFKDGLAPLVASTLTGAVLLSFVMGFFLHDPGWRMAAFGAVASSIWLFLKLVEHEDVFWRWLAAGLMLGAALLIHLLAFLAAGIALVVLVFGLAELRKQAFGRGKLVWVILGVAAVASLFYLPLVGHGAGEFGRELQSEGLVMPGKVAVEFSNLLANYSKFLRMAPVPQPVSPAVLLSFAAVVVALILGGGVVRALSVAYILSHAILLVGRTPGNQSYLVPIVPLWLVCVSCGVCVAARKVRAFLVLPVALAVAFAHIATVASPAEDVGNGTDWEVDLMSAAIAPYDGLYQDEFCVVDCASSDPYVYRDKLAWAVAIRRPGESMRLMPFGHNSVLRGEPVGQVRWKFLKSLTDRRCGLLVVFVPRRSRECSIADMWEFKVLLQGYRPARRYKLARAWMEIYERKRAQ